MNYDTITIANNPKTLTSYGRLYLIISREAKNVMQEFAHPDDLGCVIIKTEDAKKAFDTAIKYDDYEASEASLVANQKAINQMINDKVTYIKIDMTDEPFDDIDEM